jgi:electron transport complex protein RnfD
MYTVLLALLPGALASVWVYGAGVLFNLLAASLSAWIFEALCLRLRGRPILPRLGDHSALLTGWLLALSLPQAAPWWLVVTGVGCAIVLGKHLYGGLGQNPVNPAMLAYALLLVSAPVTMTTLWVNPLDRPEMTVAWSAFLGTVPDAYTSATVLDLYRTSFVGLTQPEIQDHPLIAHSVFGVSAGTEWVALSYLAGGLGLLACRVITWHIPVGFLGSLFLLSALFAIDPDTATPPMTHLFAGASMFAAFFILTDPVSGATSPRGRLWFAIGVGALTYLIRTFGQYPDAVAFAVLLMNFAVPIIDHYTRPRVIGRNASIRGSGGVT